MLGYGIRVVTILGATAMLVGCATEQPVDMEAVRQYRPFYTSTNPATARSVETYQVADGKSLGYVQHQSRGKATAALVYLHGISSHAGWFEQAGDLLCASGFDVFCLDRRGSGINRENRGFPSGDVDSHETLLEDIDTFVRPLRERYSEVYIVGLSWGGKLALAYVLGHQQACDGLILITPGIRAQVDAGILVKTKGALSSVFVPSALLPIPIEPEMFSKVPTTLDWIKGDPLRLQCASTRFFLRSDDVTDYVDENMKSNERPILLFLAGKDEIIDNAGVIAVLETGKQEELKVLNYEDQTHSIQFDAPKRLTADITTWLARDRQ